MGRRILIGGIVALALVAASFFAGRASKGEDASSSSAHQIAHARKTGFATLPTVRCKTSVGYVRPGAALGATTQVAMAPAAARGLAAYRDRAGTTVVDPAGWDCEAGIGVDGSEYVTAFPKGETNPGEEGEAPGDVVQLNIASACQACQAEALCTLLPEAKPVAFYYEGGDAETCPQKPLREDVSYPTSDTAIFHDPAGVAGSATGSGGADPSLGALTYTEAYGVHKVSCTLPDGDACAAIIAATILGAPAVG